MKIEEIEEQFYKWSDDVKNLCQDAGLNTRNIDH